jgi:hypothetical protein
MDSTRVGGLRRASCDGRPAINLRTPHTALGIERTHETFRKVTDASLDLGGGFYPTYHRAATATQVARAYPGFRDSLALNERHDAAGVFQSDWYRHYRR